jgi:hypothetical protein
LIQKLKLWWSTLVWWKKALFALPVGILALILVIVSLWPRDRSYMRAPTSTIPPTKGAETIEVKVDAVIDSINEDIQVAKERARNAQNEIKKADSFDAIDDVLYGSGKNSKR